MATILDHNEGNQSYEDNTVIKRPKRGKSSRGIYRIPSPKGRHKGLIINSTATSRQVEGSTM